MVMMKGLTDGTWAGGSSPEGIGNYRVLEGKEYRAIAGLSMGGGSLLSLACGIPGNFAEWGTFVPDC